jgi:aldose sugar dehydrogenase
VRVFTVPSVLPIFALLTSFGVAQKPPPIELDTQTQRIRVVTIVDGLDSPWSMAFLPNGDILVTERPGRLRLVHDGVLQPQPIAGVPPVQYQAHAGLLDVLLHPNFRTNNLIYLTYAKLGEQGGTTAILRARFDGAQLLDAKDIFVADAWIRGGTNVGGRMVFDNKGMLYASIGDRGPTGEPLAQDLSKHNGKIVRLYDDGRVPEDNPFVNRPGARPEIYTYGHRNGQGLTIHPETGQIWESEHGPMGGDEVNILQPGLNYGWPVVSFGRKYDGGIISLQPWHEGMEPPAFFWVPSIGISNILFYTGDRFPTWKDHLIVTGMSGRLIQTVRLKGRGQNERESILTELRREYRDIRQGPDGFIYLVVRQDARQTKNSGAILRIEPVNSQ